MNRASVCVQGGLSRIAEMKWGGRVRPMNGDYTNKPPTFLW